MNVLPARIRAAPDDDVHEPLHVIENDEGMLRQLGDESSVDGFFECKRIGLLHVVHNGTHVEERAATFLVQPAQHRGAAHAACRAQLDHVVSVDRGVECVERALLSR